MCLQLSREAKSPNPTFDDLAQVKEFEFGNGVAMSMCYTCAHMSARCLWSFFHGVSRWIFESLDIAIDGGGESHPFLPLTRMSCLLNEQYVARSFRCSKTFGLLVPRNQGVLVPTSARPLSKWSPRLLLCLFMLFGEWVKFLSSGMNWTHQCCRRWLSLPLLVVPRSSTSCLRWRWRHYFQ